MSPRAAWRLESFGFTQVYDYDAGKLDWIAAGLPSEGRDAERPRAGDVARKDVPTCSLDERIGDVRERVRAVDWDACVVVNEERIVLGLLRHEQLETGNDEPVEQVMRPGPSTFRPHVAIEEMATFMIDHDVASSPITTSDGRLVGVLLRADAAKAALKLREQHEKEHEYEHEQEPERS
ncbi:MAG TPA: CBS domain-containing protein [Actinomycetota bacterium]|nr:CBS domain-containing protein [Actinomycetota bacterium]